MISTGSVMERAYPPEAGDETAVWTRPEAVYLAAMTTEEFMTLANAGIIGGKVVQ